MIKKKSLAEEVAEALRKDIIKGKYLLDEKLPIEPELMKRFGVGRSSIREAIKLLSNAGFLRVQQGLGTFVNCVNAQDGALDERLKRANIEELQEVRQLLEMKIAEKAALNRSEVDIAKLRQYLDQRISYAEANDILNCIEADINFHTALAEASRNELLTDLYQTSSKHVKNWFISIYTETTDFQVSHPLHEKLLQHIIKQEAEKAFETVKRIIRHQY
ncbi:FadR/GntR family transcriptional regulator [Pelobium manganitolerans]|uniref:FadR/GntR family transcriptional regulator n=1 Tax=Pelobium manganitolerans TaxID=1842495 RepID=UPI003FA3996B